MTAYDGLRAFADSYGLIGMFVFFMILCAWPFRPGAQKSNSTAANSIFEEHDDDE